MRNRARSALRPAGRDPPYDLTLDNARLFKFLQFFFGETQLAAINCFVVFTQLAAEKIDRARRGRKLWYDVLHDRLTQITVGYAHHRFAGTVLNIAEGVFHVED